MQSVRVPQRDKVLFTASEVKYCQQKVGRVTHYQMQNCRETQGGATESNLPEVDSAVDHDPQTQSTNRTLVVFLQITK
jgi:hypothetical protein